MGSQARCRHVLRAVTAESSEVVTVRSGASAGADAPSRPPATRLAEGQGCLVHAAAASSPRRRLCSVTIGRHRFGETEEGTASERVARGEGEQGPGPVSCLPWARSRGPGRCPACPEGEQGPGPVSCLPLPVPSLVLRPLSFCPSRPAARGRAAPHAAPGRRGHERQDVPRKATRRETRRETWGTGAWERRRGDRPRGIRGVQARRTARQGGLQARRTASKADCKQGGLPARRTASKADSCRPRTGEPPARDQARPRAANRPTESAAPKGRRGGRVDPPPGTSAAPPRRPPARGRAVAGRHGPPGPAAGPAVRGWCRCGGRRVSRAGALPPDVVVDRGPEPARLR
jgi:hypothetical protein